MWLILTCLCTLIRTTIASVVPKPWKQWSYYLGLPARSDNLFWFWAIFTQMLSARSLSELMRYRTNNFFIFSEMASLTKLLVKHWLYSVTNFYQIYLSRTELGGAICYMSHTFPKAIELPTSAPSTGVGRQVKPIRSEASME